MKRVIEAGGIDYAVERMEFYRNAALQSLSIIPETPSKLALIDLVHYTIDRKK
ncbi:MAG: hypothetical protein ACKO66_01865 [Flavobacteriales bacterium]